MADILQMTLIKCISCAGNFTKLLKILLQFVPEWPIDNETILVLVLPQKRLLHSPRVTQPTLIAKFMGPTWGPPGADRTQLGPMWATWTLLSGYWRKSSRSEWVFDKTWTHVKQGHPSLQLFYVYAIDLYSTRRRFYNLLHRITEKPPTIMVGDDWRGLAGLSGLPLSAAWWQKCYDTHCISTITLLSIGLSTEGCWCLCLNSIHTTQNIFLIFIFRLKSDNNKTDTWLS